MSGRLVALVLPRKEGFAGGEAGAISLIVRDLASCPDAEWSCVVLGRETTGTPFPGVAFAPVRPSLLGRLLGRNASYALAVAERLRALRARIVEVHNRPDMALHLARVLAPTPVVLVLHNDPQSMRKARSPRERTALLRRLAAICCVSGYIRQRLLDGVSDEAAAARAQVMHNGLPLQGDAPSEEGRRQRILFVGRVTRDKGADTFVAACAQVLPRLPGWTAAIIGADRFRADSPVTGFVREVTQAAERAGIEMLGFQPNDATLDCMRHSAILAVPSRWNDPFPRVAQEAMASGAALITTRRGGLPEAAGDTALYVDPEDPAELAAAIERLAGDAALRTDLARRAWERVQCFSLPATQTRWTMLRRALVG